MKIIFEITVVVLTAVDVNKLVEKSVQSQSILLERIAKTKDIGHRDQLINAVNVYVDAINKLSMAYLVKLAEENISKTFTKEIKTLKSEIALTRQAMESIQPTRQKSFSQIVKEGNREAARVTTNKGITMNVPKSISFVIKPKEMENEDMENKRTFEDTKKIILQAIKPEECSLKVRRIVKSGDNGIRIVADKADLDKIKKLESLKNAGLNVNVPTKLNPRLNIHGVDATCGLKALEEKMRIQNLTMEEAKDLKVVYIFPPRKERDSDILKPTTSCIIETTPDIRIKLLSQKRVFVGWNSCRVEDYIQVWQCYRCLDFGHTAGKCNKPHVCAHCSESHDTRTCPNKAQPHCCYNCKKANNTSHQHTAIDTKTCPIIQRRLKDRAQNINYG